MNEIVNIFLLARDKLFNKAFNIAKNPKYDGYQRVFALVVNKIFDKEFWWSN